MITLENFGPNNRERNIGNSLYLICLDEVTKKWYILECYSTIDVWATGKAFYGHDLGNVIGVLNSFTEEKEIVSQKALKNRAKKAPDQKKENTIGTAAPESKDSNNTKIPVKPKTISQDLFKQMIFDILMESQDQISTDVIMAFLDILDRYDIGSPWRHMEDGKPASGKYFFIKLKKSAGYTDPYWQEPILAVRMKGGFHVAGRPFSDTEVEAYSEIRIPRE